MKSFALVALLYNLSIEQVLADQPVHCLKDDAFGEWDFHVSATVDTVDLFQTQEICTHRTPNIIQIVSGDHAFKFDKEEVWRVKFLDNFIAEASNGASTVGGTWSTVYDQAFKVELDNGMRFISNFRYNIKKNLSQDPLQDGASSFSNLKTDDYGSFESKCSESMVGFVQSIHGSGSMKAHKAQCFYAKQVKHYDLEKSVLFDNGDGVKIDKIVGKGGAAQVGAQTMAEVTEDTPVQEPADDANVQLDAQIFQRTSSKRVNAHHEHVPSDENDLMISAINSLDLGWKADVCKLQKHHADYGAHCDQPLELAQTSAKSGEDQQETLEFGHGEAFKSALEEAQKFQKKYQSADQIPDEELPDNFDWRNVGGYDFTNKHRDQGHCGSCYTVTFTQIAESRLKIKYGKEIPQLSPQYLMMCNYMNEGCDGGWPYFHGFLAENGYLVTEECAPYKGRTKGDSCGNYAQCEPHSKIQSSYFIGKGYGDTSEKKIMRDLIRNGPVNGELNCPHVFGMYTSGVMTADGIKKLHNNVLQLAQTKAGEENKPSNITDKTLKDYGISWQNLNHSVTIIGWGTDPENGQKYWIIRNSYGSTWGDHGEFMVQRGTNDFGIESETTAYDPVLCSETQC